MKVPFLDLQAHHEPIREQLDAAIAEVIDSGAFAGGPFVAAFERDFAAYCGANFAIGVGNGTDALWLSLLALGVGPGDEVITVPNTFMATTEAISFCGARPVFVDIEDSTFTMDPRLLEQSVTPRTKAIIPVHLFGQMSDLDPILEVARKHGVPVIEDACQAHGARYKTKKYDGKRAGTFGATGCFSYYPGKNLGALGEAGAVVTNDPELESKIKVLRDHGQSRKYYHSQIGWNARMDGIQGAALRVKLKQLDAANARRRSHAHLYDQLLRDVDGILTPAVAAHNEHVYHIYAVRVSERDRVLQEMGTAGVSCAIHYPVPIHLQEAYHGLGYPKGSFPVAERCAEQFLSLPMYPELSESQIQAVAEALKTCVVPAGCHTVESR
jgi:dTDP-4-amino-4,6-dideoxygalactose transaminase